MRGKAALAPKTTEQYEYLLNSLLFPKLGDVALVDLTPARVRSWRAELLRAGRPYPAVQAAGVERLRCHNLRHFAGTLATVSGATVREVQARLGHASPAAAYRYQHVLESRDAEIAERLDGVFRAAGSGAKNARKAQS